MLRLLGKGRKVKKGDAVSTFTIIFNTQFRLWITINPTADEQRTLIQTLLYLFVDKAMYVRRRRELSASDQTKMQGKIPGYSTTNSSQSLDLGLKEYALQKCCQSGENLFPQLCDRVLGKGHSALESSWVSRWAVERSPFLRMDSLP